VVPIYALQLLFCEEHKIAYNSATAEARVKKCRFRILRIKKKLFCGKYFG